MHWKNFSHYFLETVPYRFINKRIASRKGEDAESRVGVLWIPLNELELVGETRGGFWKSLAGCRPRESHMAFLSQSPSRV